MNIVKYLFIAVFAISFGGLQGRTLNIENRSGKVVFVEDIDIGSDATCTIKGRPVKKGNDGYKLPNKKTIAISSYGKENMVITIKGNNFSKEPKKMTIAFKPNYITIISLQRNGAYSSRNEKM